jgi:hypothetical protein
LCKVAHWVHDSKIDHRQRGGQGLHE